ncbi:adenylyl-sulfate kinase [Vicingaceae bacterium]|nr:adenylyl-sulfate kinase [Vicingaceae bacterium]
MNEKTEVTWHEFQVNRARGVVVWFTGLSGSGKSTVANAVDARLSADGIASFVLDGDNIRHGLNASREILEPVHGKEFAERFGLGFGQQDREENIRRIGGVAEILCSAGLITLTAFVSPYRRDRDMVRQYVTHCGTAADFVEVFVDTPLEICEKRDPKGLYKKARAGEIKNFTGIGDPYESPSAPELRLASGELPVEELADQVVTYLKQIGKIGIRPNVSPND